MPRKRRKTKRAEKSNSRKPGVSGARFRKDAAFKNSRLAAADFGRASRCAVLLRRELVDMLEDMRQHVIHRTLTQTITELLRKKRASGTERVRLNDINWTVFNKMEFNKETGLVSLLFNEPGVTVDRVSGKIEITHPSFNITPKVQTKKSVTHVRLIAGAAAINFNQKKACHDYVATSYFPKDKIPGGEIKLSMQLPAPVVDPVFVAFGLVCAAREHTEELYPLANRRYRALTVIYAQPAPPPAYKAKAATPAKNKVTPKSTSKKPIKKAKPKSR